MGDEGPGKEELSFRYSREHRLKHASEAVRRLNDPGSRRRPALMQTLVPNRASAFLLLAIFMLSATVVVTRLLIPPADTAVLSGNRFVLSAFRFQGGTYLALKKSRLSDDAYRGSIDLTIRGSDESIVPATRRIAMGEAKAEEFRFSIDGEHEKIEVALSGGGATVTLKTTSE